jgi:hypothetical protein
MTSRIEFPDLIAGKRVAIVGPAESIGDQGAEVEACDTVIRIKHRWRGGEPVQGYGTRIDVGFYNIAASRNLTENQTLLDSLSCIVLKHGHVPVSHPNLHTATQDPFPHANQVPILVNHLEQFEPAGIFIFGADFFTGGPESFSPPQYRACDTLEKQWESINTHNQGRNHAWLKAFQERTGLIRGDSRMVELLSLSTEEVVALVNEAWRKYSG